MLASLSKKHSQSPLGGALPRLCAAWRGALAGASALAAVAMVNPALADKTESAAPACTLSSAGFDQPLSRTRLNLTQGRAITIVAIGSSSTEGAGASSPGAAYPSRLEALLSKRFPGVAIRVLNRGVGGEDEPDMLARFDRDVVAAKPDLVLWQLGSNAIMRHRRLSTEEALIRKGIARLKRTGADVVLIDPQYTIEVLAQPVAVPIVDIIASEARRQQVGVFRRFELMKDWRESQRIPSETFSDEDGMHMNDWGYDCFARNLAAAIIGSAMPAVASAPRIEQAE